MPKIKVSPFGGLAPRMTSTMLDEKGAEIAENVKLWHGTLEAFREPKPIHKFDKTCIKSIFHYGCCWFGFENECVSITGGIQTCPRLYATGVKEYPTVAAMPQEGCELNWKRLGLPKPLLPVTITSPLLTPASTTPFDPLLGVQRKREPRDYVYSYVNSFGEEGAFSAPMYDIPDIDQDAVITVGIPPLPTTGEWDIVKIRLYRSSTGYDVVGDKEMAANWFFVDEFPATQSVYIDSGTPATFGDMENSEHYTPPPPDLKGLEYLDNGVIVGFKGNELWFSEPYQFQAFPVKYLVVLSDNIIGIRYSAGVLYVLTDGHPYTIAPNSDDSGMRDVFRFNDKLPCVSARSIAATASGVIYSSLVGLARIQGRNAGVDTHSTMDEDSWSKYLPHRVFGSVHNGRYYGFANFGGFIWDFRDGTFHDGDVGANSLFTTLSVTPQAVQTTRDGKLYMSFDGQVCEWDAGDKYMQYRWRSKENFSPQTMNFAVAKINFEKWVYPQLTPSSVKFEWLSDKKEVFSNEINSSRFFRLPHGFKGNYFQFEITGREKIRDITIATSVEDLTR